jgi:hypothetical protein
MIKKIRIQNNIFPFLLIISMLIFSSEFILAMPPLPTEIYGVAKSYNQFIPSGTIISVYDSDGNICGAFTARNTSWNASYFGVLTCRGEDNYSVGPVEGEILHFRIGSAFASTIAFNGYIGNVTNDSIYFNYSRVNVTWESGTFKQVIVVAPPLVCGDGFCDSYENCNSCVSDCGECPSSNTTDSNNTGGGSGSGGGGGDTGDTGGTTGVTDQTSTGDSGTGDEGSGEGDTQEVECLESWICGEWQECLPSGKQIRECVDLNACGTSEDMPEIVQNCEYKIKGVVMSNETTYNETVRVPPRKESPLIITVCKERLKLLSIPSLLFFILVMIILFIAEADYRKKIKHINSDKKLDELKKLELRYIEYRKKVIFFVLIIVLSIIVYLYHYFFFLCKDKYVQYLWLLSWGIILVPIIVHVVLALSKYSDSQKNKRLQTLNDVHYKHIEVLREIANRELIMAEDNITTRIYDLERKDEFNKLLTEDKIVNKIYLDMTKLFNLYKTLKNPMNIEKDLLENIRKLDQDVEFLDAAKLHPELAEIRASLSALYSAYGYKQSLYDELAKTELEHGVRSPILR